MYNIEIYKKIQEIYNVYQRLKPQNKNEIREIDLNYISDIAYLNCIVKRDIRKSGYIGYLEDEILKSNAGQVEMRVNENFPDCIEVYNPSIGKGLIWEPKTKRILQFT